MHGLSWSWSYGSWIYDYLCNQWLSPPMLGVRILLRRDVLDITICDKVCQWLTAGQWFSPDTLVTSTNKTDCHDITGCKVKISHIKILYISLFVCTCMYVWIRNAASLYFLHCKINRHYSMFIFKFWFII